MPDASVVRRRAVLIAVAAVVPSWIFRSIIVTLVLRTGDTPPWALVFSGPALLMPALSLLLCVGVVVLLDRRGLFRSDRWWLAGGLFVVATAAAALVVEVPVAGDGVFIDFTVSLLAGPWIIVFAAGSIAWRRLTPAYPPIAWLRPPDPWDE